MTIAASVWNRLYGDFLMPSRLGDYERLLESALRAQYTILSVEDAWRLIESGGLERSGRYLVLRHDIDAGPRTAGAMWQIEQHLGLRTSYYFRLSTLDISLMRTIGGAGGEASYHYEELATIAKERHLRSRTDILRHVPEAQERFRRNLAWLRDVSGQPMRIVAGHGDFVNRATGVLNTALLADADFRREVGIELETYDPAFMSYVTSRHADLSYPATWTPSDPAAAIERGEPVVYVLVHPGCWHVERLPTARDDALRVWQGLVYALPVKPRHESRRANPISRAARQVRQPDHQAHDPAGAPGNQTE